MAKYVLLLRPVVTDPVPDQHVVSSGFYAVVNQLVAMVKIDDQRYGVRLGQRVAMHADSHRCGQLRVDAMVLKGHAVIAGVTRLRSFVERTLVFVPPHFARANCVQGMIKMSP